LLALLEEGDGLVDPALAGFRGLGTVDVVDVVALQAARQLREKRLGRGVGGQGGGEVTGDVNLAGALGEVSRSRSR
jgi:hypothetical protein